MSGALRLTGELDVDALDAALRDLVERHQPLRTVIGEQDGEPVGCLLPVPATLLAVEDLPGLPRQDRKQAFEQHLAAEPGRRFDLARDCSLRARLLRLGDDEHVLVLSLHHGAADGISIGLLCRELATAHRARLAGKAPDLVPLAVSYADHAVSQAGWLDESGARDRELAFWTDHLAEAPERLDLPTDHIRTADRSRRAAMVPVALSAEVGGKLQALADAQGSTLFPLLLAGFGALLGRLARQEEVVIGTPVAGRMCLEAEPLIGFFVNTLALKVDLSGTPDGTGLLDRTAGLVRQALEHQQLPFEYLVEHMAVPRSLAVSPVFQAMFAWQNQEAFSLALDGLDVEPIQVPPAEAKFDLSLSLAPLADGGIEGALVYDASLFEAGTMERWAAALERVLVAMAARPEAPVASLDLLDEAERRQVVTGFNATAEDFPGNKAVLALFAAQAAEKPERIAFVDGDREVSYAALDRMSNRLARHLIGLGVGPEVVVGVCLERSSELIVSLLAILKAGGAYLPLDPDYPPERLGFMAEDAGAHLTITTRAAGERVAIRSRWLELDDAQTIAGLSQLPDDPIGAAERSASVDPRTAAYVIYTSGSTGRPKGVVVENRNLGFHIRWLTEKVRDVPRLRILFKTSMGFDASAREIWLPLCRGDTICCLREPFSQVDIHKMADLGVTSVCGTPSFLRAVLDAGDPDWISQIEYLYCGGEALLPDLRSRARDLLANAMLMHGYGPTETTLNVTGDDFDKVRSDSVVSIGAPIANTQVYVVDGCLNPQPVGVVGEVLVGGVQVGRGYSGRPGLTAERFIADPFSAVPGARLYRTGDLARWRSDGTLEFLGRVDSQVKVRGMRVELGEIEEVLLACQGISQAVVETRRHAGDDVNLVAWVVPEGGVEPDPGELRAALGEHLPDYMVPAAIMAVEALPLTPNGKLDRKALPEPDLAGCTALVPSETETEALLCGLFREVTGVTELGVDHGFFELGGHSLSAMRLMAKLRRQTGRKVPLRALFKYPTPRSLAKVIDDGDFALPYTPLLPLRRTGTQPPLFCIHPASGLATCYQTLADHLDADIPVWGLQAKGLETEDEPDASIDQMAETYLDAICSVQPQGPYRLLGWSLGGRIAHAMTCELEVQGQQVSHLIMLDTPTEVSYPGGPAPEQDVEAIRFEQVAAEMGLSSNDLPAERDQALEQLMRAAIVKGVLSEAATPDFVERMLTSLRRAGTLAQHHQLRRCAAPIHLFRAGTQPARAGVKGEFHWQRHTSSAVKVATIECTHARMMEAEPVRAIAQALSKLWPCPEE